MNDNRRDFLKKGASLAAAISIGGLTPALALPNRNGKASETAGYVKDAGMQMCEAYFFGLEEQKIALTIQLEVTGAVSGINPRIAGLQDVKPWEYKAVQAVKEAYAKQGLQFRVVEGPPSLGTLTKLGLPGRDEEIENFITLMQNLKKAGIDVICYNWMPVISWARTANDRAGRGGAGRWLLLSIMRM